MRRIVIAALAAAVIVPSASAAAPRIVIANTKPLIVAGSHFKARERVTVTFGESTRHVRANALGSFETSFGVVVVDRCSGWTIAAAGALGDRAVLVQARAKCAPAQGE
jgi:hypothetical protein